MNKLVILGANRAAKADVARARLGTRFGRLDLASQLALLAVEPLAPLLAGVPPERVAICLEARGGSLSTDVAYWDGRLNAGGPSPTLFAYTLPSAAIAEIAIRHRWTGPNLCLVGDGKSVLTEAADCLRRGEADACVCVYGNVVTPAATGLIQARVSARACALALRAGGRGLRVLGENDRDIEGLCAKLAPLKTPNESDDERTDQRAEGKNN